MNRAKNKKNDNSLRGTCRLWPVPIALVVLLSLLNPPAFAHDAICARVKIEIKQELTLERQAFDANMVINSGLEGVSLDNVRVDVQFSDENGVSVLVTSDPNDTTALFFIRLDSMT